MGPIPACDGTGHCERAIASLDSRIAHYCCLSSLCRRVIHTTYFRQHFVAISNLAEGSKLLPSQPSPFYIPPYLAQLAVLICANHNIMSGRQHSAIAYEEFGPPSVMKVVQVATPKRKPGEVLIKTHAAGVNPLDWKVSSSCTPMQSCAADIQAEALHVVLLPRLSLPSQQLQVRSGVHFPKFLVSRPQTPGGDVAGIIEDADESSKVNARHNSQQCIAGRLFATWPACDQASASKESPLSKKAHVAVPERTEGVCADRWAPLLAQGG